MLWKPTEGKHHHPYDQHFSDLNSHALAAMGIAERRSLCLNLSPTESNTNAQVKYKNDDKWARVQKCKECYLEYLIGNSGINWGPRNRTLRHRDNLQL